jgi:acetyl esterase/lipase
MNYILNLKNWIVAISLAMLLIFPVFSQQLFEKHVFVYKIVKGHEIKANIFLPNTNQKHPVVVYFHGGGFVFGNRDEGLEDVLRDKLLAHNYAVVSADYRLAPETKLDDILKDVSDVVIWLREKNEQFQIDINKIAIVGGSAAGYLALSTGYSVKPSPQAIVAISTPTDFSKANTQKGDESILKQPGPC